MITKKCRDCGKEFTLTDGEINFYRSKGFELPNRCKSCRDKKKKNASTESHRKVHSERRSEKQKSALTIPVLLIAAALLLCYLIFYIGSDIPLTDQSETADITAASVYITEESAASETTYTFTANEINNTTDNSSETAAITSEEISNTANPPQKQELHFRSEELLSEHYQKHGIEMGFSSAEEYERAASNVVSSPEALHKLEKEDNDDVYYLESTNEFVIVSTDGYIRTYFYPDSGKDYFDKQ